MSIISKHFDTRLGQNIEAYDKEAKKQQKLNTSAPKTEKITSLKEELNNTLLEYFFPDTEFSFGHGDEFTTIDELKNHPDDHKLLISSKSRYLYADESAFEIVDEIFPDRKDRGAYGSILLGECNKGKDSPPPLSGKLNILIVDDETGENGGIIDKEQAYRLTGDCYGQISDEKYKELTGHKEGDKYRVIQHRFGWKPQEADEQYRFGKGTLRPMDFNDIQYETGKDSKIDLIVPISSLKGTDKQRPGGALKPQIKPGLYELDIWIGEKSLSQQGKTATSQIWASFPEGQKDALEKSNAEAFKLYYDSKDPRKLAQLYCEKYEKRKKFDQERLQKEEELAASGKTSTISKEDLTPDDQEDEKSNQVEDLMMYRLVKADLTSGHGQLLETEKVKRELEKFVVREYKDIATFKNITFDRAMVIPSKDLKNGEICIPGRIDDDKEILNFRAPFLNSNGMCVSQQKHTDDILGPDGKPIEGVICVSDETTERIYDRVTKQIKTALAQVDDEKILNSLQSFVEGDITSTKDVKFKDIGDLENMQRVRFIDALNEQITELQNLGFEVELLPRESEQERQGRDYDGDCVGFTLAENFPNLTAEAIERNKPENAYLPTIKEAKQSFYIGETTEQPEFEAIALQMSDGISVGVINNHLTALEALESEIEIIRNSGDRQLIANYVDTLKSSYSKVLERNNKQEDPSKKIPEAHRDHMERITELADATNSPEVVDRIFDLNRDFYRRLNEEASYQNQIAVDLFKSNRIPDTDAIKRNSSYLHRNVNYIRDKKQEGVYQNKVVETTGYSPTEINIRRVNRHFAKHKLESRPISQFQNLFKDIEFSYQQKAEATLAKRNFDKYFNEAAELQKRQKIDEGQSVSVRTRSGLNFEITNVVRTGNFSKLKEALEQDKAFRIEVKESKNKAKPHKYEVYAQFDNEKSALGHPKYQKIGTVMRDNEHIFKDMDSLPKNLDTRINEFKAAISDAQIKVRFDKALESADAFRSSIPENQLKQYAAATWSISTKRDTSDTELGFNKSASFAFNAFTNEIVDKIEVLQFDEFTVSNLKEAELQSDSIDFNTPQEIRFGAAAIDKDGDTEIKNVIQLKTPDGEYKEIGDISATDGRLPLGTTASATISGGNLSTATLSIDNVSVKVNELNKYDTKVNSGEEIEVLIQESASYSDGETKIFIGDDYLGKLRPESHEEAVKNNWLQNNQPLQLKLDSIVDEGKHPYAIATTGEGNKLYVNIEDQYKLIDEEMQAVPNKFKGYSFDAEQVQARPIVEKTGQKPIVYVNDKPVGTISQEDFKKIEPTGASLIPKLAKIEGNVTTLKVSLDKETVQYPETWVKEREEVTGKESIAINTSEESYKVDETSSKLYQKLTTRQSIAFEDTVDSYTNTFSLAVDERQLEATEKYLNKNNVDFQVTEKEDKPLETNKGMRVITIDKESLDDKLLETIISRTGGIKSDKFEIPEIPIIKDESVYYFDPKANYGDNEYPAIGLAVPAPDSHIVDEFLGKYNLEISGFNDNNIYYFSLIDVENFPYEKYNELYPSSEEEFTEYKQDLVRLKKDLSSHLGNPLDLSDENNFNTFDKKVETIQEKLDTGYSTLERNRDIGTEYQQALQKLPKRPNIEGYVEPPAPDVSIVKKRKEARAILRIGSAYNPQTQESGASAILVSNDGKNQIAQTANYYPSEKSDLKAAYQSLIQGLNEAKDRGYKAVRIETSNNNLYQRLKCNPQYMHFNGKNKECEPLHKQATDLIKSFEWGITPKFTSYKKYPTAAQANQVANNAIAQKSSVNDFGRSEPQQASATPNQTQQVASVSSPSPNQPQQASPTPAPKPTVSRQSPPPKQQTASKKRTGLTEGQKEALSKMMEFSKQPRTDKDNNEFLLEGYAGTGKTFVIQQFLKEVRKSGENPRIAFTAPTNNAVKVLRQMAEKQGMTGFEAKTTHKLLGLKRNIDKMSGDVNFTRKKTDDRPELKYDYIVVDEASMLNESLYEHCKEASQAGVKIVYMGDPAQLPPVNESESMVFSQVKNRSELTEVVRYDGDMARIAEDIRNNLNSKNPTQIRNSQDGTVIALSKEGFKNKVEELFTSDEFKADNSSIKVIAYTNNRVDEINKLIKDKLYGEDAPEYLPGMRIIARDPVKGEFGTALDTAEEMTITKAKKGKDGNLDIWMLEGITESGERAEFDVLDSKSKPQFQRELSNLRKEIYNEPIAQRDWLPYYDLAERYGNVRPAYAITAHNSQGKTIPQGIVDQNNLNLRLSMALKEEDGQERARGIKEYNQLRYVAMTRFQNAVYVGTNQREQEINHTQVESTDNIDRQNIQEWARYAPKGKEGYELSSAGDSRFSALNAKLKDGRTIEEAYQLDVKGYRSQSDNWRLGKGKPPLTPMTKEESYQKYKELWQQWANENPQLIDELAQKSQGKVLTDKFASTNISQARALVEILNERNIQSPQQTPISLPSSQEADKSKSLEIVGKISESKVDQLRQHLETNYQPLMDADKSSYAPGRQVAWVEAKWELKDKDFSPGVKDDKLMELVKQIYPDADIALVTYSEQQGQGIDYHRDDSYAAAEARSINIGDSMWGYQASKQGMVAYDPNANDNAPIQEFKLESGTVTRFNSKNPHAALETSAGRWSINVWSIKNDLGKNNSVREKFDKFVESNQPPTAVVETNTDLTIKESEWTRGGEIKIERSYQNIQDANTAGIIRLGNATQTRAATPKIPDNPQISGKTIPMTWELNQSPELKSVSTTIDAMRGNGRVHSTRAQNYYQTYGIKEGDIAVAKGKDNKQVAFRVGKQYKITQAIINNPDYQKAWQNWEKHSVKELTENQAAKGKERQLYGLFMEPLGDYQNGKIIPFEQHKQQERTLNITFDGASRNNGKPNAQASAAAVLTNPEGRTKQVSQYLGNKTNNETEFQAAIIGMKAAQKFGYKSIQIQGDSQLVVEALQGNRNIKAANLKPLYEEAKSLLNSFDKAEISYIPREQNKAADALANKALDNAQNINPIANIEPVTEATAKHMVKDKAMAEFATQYIGISAASPDTPSSTRNYAEAWGDKANTGSYTNKDVIMISGSGPWRGVTQSQIEENFNKEYIPLLDKAIEAKSNIVVGNAKGTDELVKNYLQEKGYKLEQTSNNYAQLSSQTREIQASNKISKITSIGQLGADLGALEAAKNKGIKTGGVAANGYFTEKGQAPDLLQGYGLSEGEKGKGFGQTYKNAYSANIRSSDATVLIGRILNRNEDTDKDLIEIISRYNKPCLVIPKEEVLSNPQAAGEKIAQFASQNNAQNLNIIGERESHAPGMQNAVQEAIGKTLELNSRTEYKVKNPPFEQNAADLKTEQVAAKQKNEQPDKESSFIKTQSKSQLTQNVGTTISAYSNDGLGAALSPETKLASDNGNLQNNYPVSYQDNKELPAGNYGGENYPDVKPIGQPFVSANQAYHAYKEPSEQAAQKIARMTEVLKAKLEQHPRLVSAIAKRGGVEFLENSTHISSSQDKFWDGRGKESKFIQALSAAYTTIEKSQGKVSTQEADSVAQSLQKWTEDAQFLNRNYVDTINQIQNIYANTKKPLTENHLKTMDKDSKDAAVTKEVKNLVTRLTNTLVQDNREDGSKLVQGKRYILESNQNTGLTRITSTSTADILLSIENNQVKANNLNSDVYQSLKSAVQAVDEKIKAAQEITGYNNSNSERNMTEKIQIAK
ncbi:MAG: reverse transcriptase-like protein [Cyanobacteria bacterium P01_A01_bin.84]